MARVHHRKANKDYPEAGISKGDMYYTWEIKTGPRSSKKFRQKEPPKPWQLTSSEFLQSLYQIEDELSRLTDEDEIEGIISQLEELRDEAQERLDNMPEGLQQGPTGSLIEERINGIEGFIADLENLEAPDRENYESDEEYEEAKTEFLNEVHGLSSGL